MTRIEKRVAVIGFAIGLLFALFLEPVGAQEPPGFCRIDIVASGSVTYAVVDALSGDTIDTHGYVHTALETSSNYAMSTGRQTRVLAELDYRVRALEAQVPPRSDTLVVVLRLPGDGP